MVVYADDLAIASSPEHVNQVLTIVNQQLEQYGLVSAPHKSRVVHYLPKQPTPQVFIADVPVPQVNMFKYLGVPLHSTLQPQRTHEEAWDEAQMLLQNIKSAPAKPDMVAGWISRILIPRYVYRTATMKMRMHDLEFMESKLLEAVTHVKGVDAKIPRKTVYTSRKRGGIGMAHVVQRQVTRHMDLIDKCRTLPQHLLSASDPTLMVSKPKKGALHPLQQWLLTHLAYEHEVGTTANAPITTLVEYKQHKAEWQDEREAYTDGSKVGNRAGSACVKPNGEAVLSRPPGLSQSVYEAEIHGVYISFLRPPYPTVLRVDSRSAVQVLNSYGAT